MPGIKHVPESEKVALRIRTQRIALRTPVVRHWLLTPRIHLPRAIEHDDEVAEIQPAAAEAESCLRVRVTRSFDPASPKDAGNALQWNKLPSRFGDSLSKSRWVIAAAMMRG